MDRKIKYFDINIIILFLLLKSLKINCEDIECKKNNSLFNTKCFNNILKFDNKRYRNGHFATNQKGDLIIEFSENGGGKDYFRLFYGLKSDGRYYFKNESPTYELNISQAKHGQESNNYYYARYESNNFFVSLNNSEDNEYLFSVSSFQSVVELHDLASENYSHIIWNSKSFFNLEEDHIYSYIFPIFKIKNESTYIIVFLPRKQNTDPQDYFSESYIIKKFQFDSFDINGYYELNSTQSYNNFNNRLISAFFMDDYDILIVFFVYRTKTKDKKEYTIRFYDYDSNLRNEKEITGELNLNPGNGLFFKSFYLKENFAALIYFTGNNNGTSL